MHVDADLLARLLDAIESRRSDEARELALELGLRFGVEPAPRAILDKDGDVPTGYSAE
jgi:hypothetical protein